MQVFLVCLCWSLEYRSVSDGTLKHLKNLNFCQQFNFESSYVVLHQMTAS